MARVTYGALITELAGSIGGITFQKNSSGNIARLKPYVPVNPSQLQSDQQTALSQMVFEWINLSLSDQDSWNALAAAHTFTDPWGRSKTLNGFQWFISSALNLLSIGEAFASTAPAYGAVAAPNAFTIIASSTHIFLDVPGYWNYATDTLIVYATPPVRATSEKLRKSSLIIKLLTGINDDSFDIISDYEAAFNCSWASLYATGLFNLIVRVRVVKHLTGLSSAFTSSINKIG